MKKISSIQTIKAMLVAGLLAAPNLAFNAMAQETDFHWSPLDVLDDGFGPYAYFNDAANWDSSEVPAYTNSTGLYIRTMDNQAVGSYVTLVISNSVNLYQLMVGAGGGGSVVITNGAQVTAGVPMFGGGQLWTGVGFPDGPSTLAIGPGAKLTCGDHLWIGQGTSHGAPNSVFINGGTLEIHGQLGAGWNGSGGTNYVTLSNGGTLLLSQWAGQTLGNGSAVGIMNLASNNCHVYVTNNQTGFFPGLIASGQLIAYGGAGTVQYSFNPVGNVTTIGAKPPTNQYTPIITVQPTNVVTSYGNTVSINVGIVSASVNYQWTFNGSPLANGGAISGAQTATLTITGVSTANIGSYAVQITSTVQADQVATSTTVGVSTTGLHLYPVITILGVPGDTYVTSSSTTVNGTYTPFATNTLGSFAPFYLVDTNSPFGSKFYKTFQQ
jgi:hypothetical protein